ncbi:MAG: AbrB/MazE/SpoVT family DNA-binding domain-containing protein [Gemmatimonadales bacterium]|jgi:antitoxin MazE
MADEGEGVASKIIRIGNSRGVRIPKPLLEQTGLEGRVRLRVVGRGILIERCDEVRDGWREAAKEMRERGEAGLLDEPTVTEFDESEWTWE